MKKALSSFLIVTTLGWPAAPGIAQAAPEAQLAPISADSAQHVTLPTDWQHLDLFAGRFTAAAGDPLYIGLATGSFGTRSLVHAEKHGAERFTAPNMVAFDPASQRAPFEGSATDFFLVQATSPEEQVELRQTLESAGIDILEYIPNFAYLVRMNAADKASLDGIPSIFWMGHFNDAWKLDPAVEYAIDQRPSSPIELTVEIDRNAFADREKLSSALAIFGGEIHGIVETRNTWRLKAAGPAIEARKLASIPGALWIEHQPQGGLIGNQARTSSDIPTGRNGNSGPLMDVEDVWARGIRGEGQIAAVADTGLSTGNTSTLHRDFGNATKGNPSRIEAAFALGRTGDWSDPGNLPGGGHGTHVAGLLVGNGIESGSNPATNSYPGSSFTGIAPKGRLVIQSLMSTSNSIGGLPSDLNNLFQPAYNEGARVHSNSWRFPVSGAYDGRAVDADEFAWANKDMVLVFGAGNEGYDRVPDDGVVDRDYIGSPATAKNGITVGATENYRPGFVMQSPAPFFDLCNPTHPQQQTWGWYSDTFGPTFFSYDEIPLVGDDLADHASGMAPFSSRGPTNDLRFKPELVAPGGFVISTRTDVNTPDPESSGICDVPTAQRPYYVAKVGTSMSTPLVAGAALLTRQYYDDGWHANGSDVTNTSAVTADGFSPTSALVKATLINGAWDIAPGQYGEVPPSWDTGNDLPNNASGFGRVDLEAALFPGSGYGQDPGRKLLVHDVTTGLTTGQVQTYPISVASAGDPLTVTLVWTDPAGSSSASLALVNDLDLEVVAPGGTTYYPNGIDRTTGSADRRNNTEQVRVTSPAAGTWTVRVRGFNVPGNGGAGTNSQPYALVASGVFGSGGGNLPPIAVPDTFSTDVDTPRGIFLGQLLGNDSDPEGGPLWLDSWDLVTTQGGTNDTGHIGGFNYTPPAGFSGIDTFDYTIRDDQGQTATAQVTIYVGASEETMGEVGQVENLTHVEQTVILSRSYTNPVVFAQPPSTNGAHTSVVRVKNVQSDRFTLFVEESPNNDGLHTTERVSYVVLEAGTWLLPQGGHLQVGTVSTAAEVGRHFSNTWRTVALGAPFTSNPAVISQVQTQNGPDWLKTRQRNISAGSFQLALEQEEAATVAHGADTVGWLALSSGQGTWNGRAYEASTTATNVNHGWRTVSFTQSFTQAPRFLGAIATYNDADHAGLRRHNVSASGINLKIEEEASWDAEITHGNEAVGFLAIQGNGTLTAIRQ